MNELTSRVKMPTEQGPTQFRDYLIAEFEGRRRNNRRYSLRAYARDLQIASSLLSRILNGKVPLTSKMLRRMSSKVRVPSELMEKFVREVREHEERRKKSRGRDLSGRSKGRDSRQSRGRSMQRYLGHSPEQVSHEDDISIQTVSFLIPCNVNLIPQVTRQIQMFQKSLIDFVNQNGKSDDLHCELHLSIRYSVEN